MFVSEFLLRKTRASQAEPVVMKIVQAYPTLESLAFADSTELSKMLHPTGLQNIRSRGLLRAANDLLLMGGLERAPELNKLLSLAHVGRYVANAVLCFGFRERRAVVDANIARVFHRAFGFEMPREIQKADEIWEFANQLLPMRRFQEFNWALFDFAAHYCVARAPKCDGCPLRKGCLFFEAHSTVEQ